MAGAVAVVAAVAVVVSFILIPGKPPGQPSGHSSPVTPPKAGTEAWRFPTKGQIWSSPAVANGVVYFGSFDDYVYALSAKSGKVLWQQKTGGEVQSSPVVADGVVYIGSDDGKVYALHAAATPGKQVIWSQLIGGQVWSSPAVSSDGSMVYVGSSNNYLYALLTSPRVSNHVAWSVLTFGMIRSGPVVADNVIYVGNESGGLYAVSADGTVLWNYPAAGFVDSNPTVTVAGGVVYFGNHNGDLYAINTAGTLLWRYHVTTRRVDARPVVADNVVYIGTDSGLYALKPGGPSYSVRWHNPADALVVSGPVMAGGVLYAGTGASTGNDNGKLYALNATTGHTNWQHTIGPAIFSSPVVAGDMVFIGSEDDDLYAFYTGS